MSFDVYPWFSLLSSILIFLLFVAHAWDAAKARVRFHDDRSAYSLVIALTLAIAALGLLLSAVAAFLDIGIIGRSDVRNVGLGMVRGVLLVTASVMLVADRRVTTRASV